MRAPAARPGHRVRPCRRLPPLPAVCFATGLRDAAGHLDTLDTGDPAGRLDTLDTGDAAASIRAGKAATLDSLGYAYHHLGNTANLSPITGSPSACSANKPTAPTRPRIALTTGSQRTLATGGQNKAEFRLTQIHRSR